MGFWGFLSSGDCYIGELFELPQGCQGPTRGPRGKVAFLSRRCIGKGPRFALRGESPVFFFFFFFLVWQQAWGSFRVKTRTRGTRWCVLRKVQSPCEFNGSLGIPLQSLLGLCSSSGGEVGTSGFLSSAGMDLSVPLEFPQGSQISSHVETCKSALLSN